MLIVKEKENNSVLSKGLAVPHAVIDGEQTFDVLLARCREGVVFSPENPLIRMVFVLVGTKDERNFHLQALSAIARVIAEPGLESKWLAARDQQALRDVILLAERRRH